MWILALGLMMLTGWLAFASQPGNHWPWLKIAFVLFTLIFVALVCQILVRWLHTLVVAQSYLGRRTDKPDP